MQNEYFNLFSLEGGRCGFEFELYLNMNKLAFLYSMFPTLECIWWNTLFLITTSPGLFECLVPVSSSLLD